jgi:hypothetical protein
MIQCVIRAAISPDTVRVYEVYRPEIANAAPEAGTFVPPVWMARMTWTKASFHWIMHRCGLRARSGRKWCWGIDITRAGFEWALEHGSVLVPTETSTPLTPSGEPPSQRHRGLQHPPSKEHSALERKKRQKPHSDVAGCATFRMGHLRGNLTLDRHFSEGCSQWSTTSTCTGSFCGCSFRPSCS